MRRSKSFLSSHPNGPTKAHALVQPPTNPRSSAQIRGKSRILNYQTISSPCLRASVVSFPISAILAVRAFLALFRSVSSVSISGKEAAFRSPDHQMSRFPDSCSLCVPSCPLWLKVLVFNFGNSGNRLWSVLCPALEDV